MNTLEVKTSKLHFVLTALLGLFFVPMGAGLIISGLSRNFDVVPLGISAMCLVMYALIFRMVLRAYRKSVRNFTNEGLTRVDGQRFAWTELERVVSRIGRNRSGRPFRWRCEITFKGGDAAWVIPSKISNYEEVIRYVDNLPCEHVQK